MKIDRRDNANPRRRRGVTLVEMLVTLAVLLLIMALVVQVFQAATSTMNAAQVYQRIDDEMRRFDTLLRQDLSGATARFTPPLDPKDNLGYFEYIENEFADIQGEDGDDALRFTVKAPEGRPFVGRMWARPPAVLVPSTYGAPNHGYLSVPSYYAGMSAVQQAMYFQMQPVTVTSEHAEVIYFLRNGNLYRRVLLVAPELQSRIVHSYSRTEATPGAIANSNWAFQYGATGIDDVADHRFQTPTLGNTPVSWQGVNDLSARPAARGVPELSNGFNSVILNTLGDLTDRHNRFPSPRFTDDFVNLAGNPGPDGVPDDVDGDNVPDWYPTLYPRVIDDSIAGGVNSFGLWNVLNPTGRTASPLRYAMAFPYLYRGAFSQAQNNGVATARIGWMHSPAPFGTNGTALYQFNDPTQAYNYLMTINHNPMDLGDDLPAPTNASANANNLQTWWGFPTWRETLAPQWVDPTFQVNQPSMALPYGPFGLAPLTDNEVTRGYVFRNATDMLGLGRQLLPPMTGDWRGFGRAQPYTDGAGSDTAFFSNNQSLWTDGSWEDDLIMTNVRSFDVKAFEPALADYADLGWGDDARLTPLVTSDGKDPYLGTNAITPYLMGLYDANLKGYPSAYVLSTGVMLTAYAHINGSQWDVLNQTFAHEGRMPPLRQDNRYDAQFGYVPQGTYASNTNYNGNVGDDTLDVTRMRRVWDSWSTTYSKAPANGVEPGTGFPFGPPFSPPVYPSYPPPYPAPLRGIQVQVRVTDPTNERIKVLTIRQDFTDKL